MFVNLRAPCCNESVAIRWVHESPVTDSCFIYLSWARVTPFLLQAEPLLPHERAEILPLRRRALPRLVLRPAVEFRRPVTLDVALPPVRQNVVAPAIVGVDVFLQP